MKTISVGVECGPVPNLDVDVAHADAAIFGSTVRLAANLVGEGSEGDIILGPAMAAEMRASESVSKVGEKVIRGFESQGPIAIYRWVEK
jgi:class 3 adenylate cyclase